MADWRTIIETSINPVRNKISNRVNQKMAQIFFDEPLSKHTTFRIGGKAECFIVVNRIEELKKVIRVSSKEKIPIFIIGRGSNLLISNQGFEGIVLKLGTGFSYISKNGYGPPKADNDVVVSVGASTPLSDIVKYGLKESLGGLEFLWSIPATFGGAVRCNAGAFSRDIGGIVLEIHGFLANGVEISLKREQLKFAYRNSNLPAELIITDGLLSLIPTEKSKIKQQVEKYKEVRSKTQPLGLSAGSIFKNPVNASAGKLIDESNLKGIKYHDAIVSSKHANFIINQGKARFIDVYELIQIIKSKVELKTNKVLQEEVQIIPKYQEVIKWQNQRKY